MLAILTPENHAFHSVLENGPLHQLLNCLSLLCDRHCLAREVGEYDVVGVDAGVAVTGRKEIQVCCSVFDDVFAERLGRAADSNAIQAKIAFRRRV